MFEKQPVSCCPVIQQIIQLQLNVSATIKNVKALCSFIAVFLSCSHKTVRYEKKSTPGCQPVYNYS